MTNNLYLLLHTAGAAVSLAMISASVIACIRSKIALYRPLAIGLAVAATFQMISGALLAASLPAQPSALSFCGRIGLYLSIIAAAEIALWIKIASRRAEHYPLKTVLGLSSPGIAIIAATVIHLYAL